jgi:hypothetical protein
MEPIELHIHSNDLMRLEFLLLEYYENNRSATKEWTYCLNSENGSQHHLQMLQKDISAIYAEP